MENKLEPYIEDILDMLADGKTYADICKKYEASTRTLFILLSSGKYSARAREARLISSNTFADKAESTLKEAEGTKEEIARARELAHHYRWRAAKANPKDYGEHVEVDQKVTHGVSEDIMSRLVNKINSNSSTTTLPDTPPTPLLDSAL